MAYAFTYQPEGAEQTLGKPGEDGRPSNVEAKLWDADKKSIKVDVLHSQYKFFQRKVSEKFGETAKIIGAPAEGKDYEVTVPDDAPVQITADDPQVRAFTRVARKYDLAQSFVSEVIKETIAEFAQTHSPEAQAARIAAEMKSLGPDALQRTKDVKDWMNANIDPAHMPVWESLVQDAATFQAFEALIAATRAPKFVDRGAAPASGGQPTKADWEKFHFATNERGDRLVAIDPEYRKRSEAMRDAVFGTTRRDASGRATA